MDVQGKSAIVTGAGSGIGRATALRLSRERAGVVVADLNEGDGRESVRLIEEAGGTARFFQVDTTDEAGVEAMVAFAERELGGLDILYNNAGIVTGQRFPDAESARWQRVLDINLRGMLLGTHYGVQALKRRGGGVIIQTASAAGLGPWAADPIYSATKAGVVNFVRSLTFLKDEAGIRVNCVCPGLVATNIGQHAREAQSPQRQAEMDRQRERMAGLIGQLPALAADDVAGAVLQLITDDSLNGKAYRIAANQQWELE